MRGEANILEALKTGFASLGDIPKDLFIGTHLWFLYYLLIVSLGVLLMRYLFCLYKPMHHKLTRLADMIIRWVCSSRLAIFVTAIPIAGCLWFMSHWGIDTPDKALTPQLPVLLLYGGFFLFGWLLHRQVSLMAHFGCLTWDKFALCILSKVITNWISSYEMNQGHHQYNLLKTCFALSYAIMMWSLVSLTIGIFNRLFDRPSITVRYVADSSYWLYIIHLPIVIWLQIAFAEFSLHWSIKLVTISVLTIFISIVLYDLFVRSTFIGAFLNGKRKPRFLF